MNYWATLAIAEWVAIFEPLNDHAVDYNNTLQAQHIIVCTLVWATFVIKRATNRGLLFLLGENYRGLVD